MLNTEKYGFVVARAPKTEPRLVENLCQLILGVMALLNKQTHDSLKSNMKISSERHPVNGEATFAGASADSATGINRAEFSNARFTIYVEDTKVDVTLNIFSMSALAHPSIEISGIYPIDHVLTMFKSDLLASLKEAKMKTSQAVNRAVKLDDSVAKAISLAK